MTKICTIRRFRCAFRRSLARVETALWIFAGLTLATAAWMKADEISFQLRARETLSQAATPDGRRAPATDTAATLSAPALPAKRVPVGTPIARLAIPRLALDVVVAEGTSNKVLRRAVGHLPGSAHPGQPGNVVLAGHRDTFFRPLADLETGDEIVVEDETGRHAYRVEWTAVVKPDRIDMIAPLDQAALTLVTCYPFNYVGNAPMRFIVRAHPVDTAAV